MHFSPQVSPEKFMETFGTPIENAMDLLSAKVLINNKLLALAPPGTLDPTPHLYDTTMYALSGMMAVAFVAHGMVRPVSAGPSAMDVAAVAKGQVVDVTGKVISDETKADK